MDSAMGTPGYFSLESSRSSRVGQIQFGEIYGQGLRRLPVSFNGLAGGCWYWESMGRSRARSKNVQTVKLWLEIVGAKKLENLHAQRGQIEGTARG